MMESRCTEHSEPYVFGGQGRPRRDPCRIEDGSAFLRTYLLRTNVPKSTALTKHCLKNVSIDLKRLECAILFLDRKYHVNCKVEILLTCLAVSEIIQSIIHNKLSSQTVIAKFSLEIIFGNF